MGANAELATILETGGLKVVFQPIVTVATSAVLGHEALMRGPARSTLRSPAQLIAAAERAGRLFDLERVALRAAVASFTRQQVNGKLFLNLSPAAVEGLRERGEGAITYLSEYGIEPNRIVLEVTEVAPIDDYAVTRETLRYFRRLGFSFALDDVGAGYSGLRHLNELHPDFVKIDRHFIESLDRDDRKRHLVQFMQNAAHNLSCGVIAEGVETEDELRVLRELGVDHVQGYLLARPSGRCVSSLAIPQPQPRLPVPDRTDTADSILRPAAYVRSDSQAVDVARRFEEDEILTAVAVVDASDRPLGVITRTGLQGKLAKPYGRALAVRKAISEYAEPALVVPCSQALDSLSRRITESPNLRGDEVFLIVDAEGRFAGVGTLIDLLRRITDLKVEAARHSNPLSGLPGNMPVHDTVNAYLENETDFVLAHFDIDEFKSYNDRYGYAAGDDVLRFLADLIRSHVSPELDFASHIGGDDFVVVFRSPDWIERCEAMLEHFRVRAPGFYNRRDRLAGGFTGTDRQGKSVRHGLISLSIGAVPAPPGRFSVHHELAHVAGEVKGVAKQRPGCQLFIDRRGFWTGMAEEEPDTDHRLAGGPEPG